jgi:osmoprotectant transport system substrate-binding protein
MRAHRGIRPMLAGAVMALPLGGAVTALLSVGAVTALLSVAVLGCGSGSASSANPGPSAPTPASASSSATATTATATLPGTGKPLITIGDKNYTEQFVLGELYRQALEAEGYSVSLNRNIGPIEVTIAAVESGRVDLYPEYLSTWDRSVAAVRRAPASAEAAYLAGQRYALAHGLQLLAPTPFSDTPGIATTRGYASDHDLKTLGDLRKVGPNLTLGGPPQFQQDPTALPALEQAYGFTPASFTTLGVGAQYQALDQAAVRAAAVSSTDGQLAGDKYVLLGDPRRVFGWGNVVPVVSAQTMIAEGPAFAATIDRVDRLLTVAVIRRLNAAIDLSGQTPAAVATQFLRTHGLLRTSGTT